MSMMNHSIGRSADRGSGFAFGGIMAAQQSGASVQRRNNSLSSLHSAIPQRSHADTADPIWRKRHALVVRVRGVTGDALVNRVDTTTYAPARPLGNAMPALQAYILQP
jgi:hypothetical protein